MTRATWTWPRAASFPLAIAIILSIVVVLTTAATGTAAGFEIQVSTQADRSNPVNLDGYTASEQVYVFTNTTNDGITQVRFWVDNPQMTGTPYRVETGAPHDLQGSEKDGRSKPLNTLSLTSGVHTVTAAIDKTAGGTEVVTATFTVDNSFDLRVSSTSSRGNPQPLDGATVSRNMYVYSTPTSGVSQVKFWVDDPTMTSTPTFTESAPPFDLQGTNSDGTARPYNTKALANGTHRITAAMTKVGGGTEVVTAAFTVDNHAVCDPLPCNLALSELPVDLNFNEDRGRILDNEGVGTGFTWVDAPAEGSGYLPSLLDVDPIDGHLDVTTTQGIAFAGENNQVNALGTGFRAPNQISRIRTTIENPPVGTGNYEQAGLYFGNDQDNFIKLIVMSTPEGSRFQSAMEVKGAKSSQTTTAPLDLTNSTVQLDLVANPFDRTVKGFVRVNGGPARSVGNFVAPGEFFSFDAAGIDPTIGTRSFAGIFGTHRLASTPLTYRFNDFSIREDSQASDAPVSDFAFNDTTTFPVPNATSMAFGPDGRLYVLEMFGRIHAYTLDADRKPVAEQIINSLGTRLALGLTIDPASTPSNVILWVSHSSPSLDNGVPNSGTISRLSGTGFTRQDVITGLPRALANHATNSIHFGPDGRLYMAQGGNTGAGAPNNANTEFGTMAEQPLSAAMLVADVKTPSFDGSCANTQDIYGPAPCDVVPYATGLRNAYDFVWHTNGSLYAPNNGLGVAGTFPPTSTAPCEGFGNTAPWTQGGNDPGEQGDFLFRILPGRYYGHPNPSRNECVFMDGKYQNTSPAPNYEPPFFNLGDHRSANATIEYWNDAFCGELQGDILIANYSVGDNLTRVKLSPDGLSVLSSGSLIGGFNDPLSMTQDADGNIFVGEFGGDRIRVLKPQDLGCWQSQAPAPVPVLDAGGAALDGKLYVVAGKTSSGHRNAVDVYDAAAGTWGSAAPLAGIAVENPAVVAHQGKLYAFGGSPQPFAGSVRNAAVYDPAANKWTTLAPMITGRTGANAAVIDGKIYVVGGMDAAGASLSSVEVYDPATNAWSSAPAMSTRRDNPGVVAIDGKLYVFGGRTRNADASTPADTLNSVEMLDPATGTWTARAQMPTSRRTMVATVINGKAILTGGEVSPGGGAYSNTEEYDPVLNSWRRLRPIPTARHGAAAGVIDGRLHVAGGGPTGGLTFTDAHESFAYQR